MDESRTEPKVEETPMVNNGLPDPVPIDDSVISVKQETLPLSVDAAEVPTQINDANGSPQEDAPHHPHSEQNEDIDEQPPTKKIKLESLVAPEGVSATITGAASRSSEPVYEMVGGSSLRQYLNKHLTEHLLEGIRIVSREKPANPLRRLGEYLIEVSAKEDES